VGLVPRPADVRPDGVPRSRREVRGEPRPDHPADRAPQAAEEHGEQESDADALRWGVFGGPSLAGVRAAPQLRLITPLEQKPGQPVRGMPAAGVSR
jgi:hypothetical protein